jgi:uncharacterized membrane protein
MVLVLVAGYSLLSHFSAIRAEPHLQWLALVVLCVIPQYSALLAGRWRNWLLLGVLAAALYALTFAGGGLYAMMLPPVLLPASVAAFFFATLRPGQVPLVTRMATLERGPLPRELLDYTRAVTVAWVVLCSALALAAALLAVLAPTPVWSLFANFIAYLLLGAMFAGEYAWRRIRFRHLPHGSFADFVRFLVRTNYRAI